MLTLLHVSDLHFGPPFIPGAAEAVLDVAAQARPDAVIISGDLTQRARPEQFAQAAEFIARLPDVPKVTVPGNHDVPLGRVHERLACPHRLYREYISDELNSVLRLDSAVIVGLDSTAPRSAISNGRINAEQLEYCAQAFEAAPRQHTRIVVAHHHFAPAPDYETGQVMPQAKRAMDCFVRLRVDLILGGHLHRAYIGNSLDVYPGPTRDHGIIIVQCGTTTSRRGRAREREKNSLNVIRIDQELLRITHYLYFSDVGSFCPVGRHVFPGRGRRVLADFAPRGPARGAGGAAVAGGAG